jgi:hypothetical protein
LTIVLYVLLWYTVSYYLFGIFLPLYWMSLEGHSIQWSKDTKEVIRNSRSKNMDVNVQYNTMVKWYQRGNRKQYIKGHSIQWSKDTKEVIRKSTSKKDIQYNGQKIPKR